MSYDGKPLRGVLTTAIAVGCLVMLLAAPSAKAQLPELWVRVCDTTAPSGAQNTVISIYMNNYQDTVAGFNLWVMLDRPDIMEFQTDSGIYIDTTWWKCLEWDQSVCIDSEMVPEDSAWDFRHIDTTDVLIGNFDTSGTLLTDWAMVSARSLTGGYDLNIAGMSFTEEDSLNRGIPPQQGGLLIKILADVYSIPDTMTDRTVNLLIIHDLLTHFNFSRPDGSSIGIAYDTILDTNCWTCTAWAGDTCANWERMPVPPDCDSIETCCPDSFVIVLDSSARVDTMTVTLLNGTLTVLPSCCANRGNVDNVIGVGGPVDVADLTYLVAFLFQGGDPPPCEEEANVDGVVGVGGPIDVADLTYLVAFLFQGGDPPPPC